MNVTKSHSRALTLGNPVLILKKDLFLPFGRDLMKPVWCIRLISNSLAFYFKIYLSFGMERQANMQYLTSSDPCSVMKLTGKYEVVRRNQ